jgi:hypothetical protein
MFTCQKKPPRAARRVRCSGQQREAEGDLDHERQHPEDAEVRHHPRPGGAWPPRGRPDAGGGRNPHTRREVLVVRVLDEPGMLGDVALVVSRADINIDSAYVTTRLHMVLGVEDLDGAIHVAQGMAMLTFE